MSSSPIPAANPALAPARSARAPVALRDRIDHWVFDLDNTLYPPSCALFPLIDARMGAFIQRLLDCDPVRARQVQKDYFHAHGTTLAGLMLHHDVDPDHFLDDVHDVTLERLVPDAALHDALAALPGRRLVFTNGDSDYAARVLDALGLSALFTGIHCVKRTGYIPKPEPAAYDSMTAALSVNPRRAIFFEDMVRNLAPAKALGMTTVWLDNGSEAGDRGHDPAFVDHRITDLASFLASITEPL